MRVVKLGQDKQGIASTVIEKFKPLYALEAYCRNTKASHRIRKLLRKKKSWPILQEVYHWLNSIRSQVLPKSKLGQAITYFFNQWPYLKAYVRHGMVEIDTNNVENKIRSIALGRKNWLFMGNAESGKIHCLWYTLIISAICNNLNTRVYLHYLLSKMHAIRRGEIDPLSLLPDQINVNELNNFAAEQLELSKQAMSSMYYDESLVF